MAEFDKAKFTDLTETKALLGHDEAGSQRLKNVQKSLFDFGATKLGVDKGRDANETAGNIVSKLTSGLGTSTAADVLRTGLQTAATVGLDPSNYVAPGVGGTVAKVSSPAKNIAKHILQTGDMSIADNVVKESAANLVKIIPRARQGGLDSVIANRIPTNTRGLKFVTGANQIAAPGIKPANQVLKSAKEPIDSAIQKASSARAAGQRVSTAPGVSTRGYDINQILDQLAKKGQR